MSLIKNPSIELEKIKNTEISLIPKTVAEKQTFKGHELFNQRYPNVFISAAKRSGKTTLVYNCIRKLVNRKTEVIIYCDTFEKDDAYQYIIKWLRKHKIKVSAYRSFLFRDGPIDDLTDLMREIDEKPDHDRILILDDLADEISHKSVANLLKKNRHSRITTIISSQYILDLTPEARKNIDVYLLRGLSLDKLQKAFNEMNLMINFSEFSDCYNYATKEPFEFLYVDKAADDYRINFDRRIILNYE